MTAEPAQQGTHEQVDRLEAAARVTEQTIDGVGAAQLGRPTPCPEYDVSTLRDHLVGWATAFADRAQGVETPTDPSSVHAGADAPGMYRAAAERMVAGYRDGPAAGAVPLGVALIETVAHGWDLAVATDQEADYPDEVVEAALAAGRAMLAPQYRGPDKSFGDEVAVDADAPPLDRLVGFMGRDPNWSA
jgi:uncharacterized protein (TIGR03086 family)